MPDQKTTPETQSPEHVSLESRFGIDESDFKAELDNGSEKVWEKNTAENDDSYQKILSKVKTQTNEDDEDDVMKDASDLHQQVDRESQITHLIDLAITKGVGHAVKVAKKAEDYYVLDQLHDRLLSDDLHDKLISQGLIE